MGYGWNGKANGIVTGFFIRVLPVIAALSLAVYLPVSLVLRHRHGKSPFLRHLSLYAFIGYCLSLLYLTLLWYYPFITFRPEWHFLNLRPFVWVNEVYEMGDIKMLEQLALNIGMFIPLGLLVPIVFRRMRAFWKTVLLALAVTIFIETLQYFMGRSADIDDVITNLLGGMIGYLLFYLINHARKRNTR